MGSELKLGFVAFLAAVISVFGLTVSVLAPFVGASQSNCGVDVYNLDVRGDVISAYVKNTGCCTKPIYYTLYIDGGVVDSGDFVLAAGSIRRFEKTYNFGYGRYEVRLTVTDNCHTDSDYMIHFVTQPDSCCGPAGYEGQRRCDYDHATVYICQGGRWTSSPGDYCYYCPQTCGDGVCNCGESRQTCPEDCWGCEPGWLNEYRCVDGWKQRKYRNQDCSTRWYNWEWIGDSCCIGTWCGITGCTGPCGTWQEGWLDNYRCSGRWVQRWFVSGNLAGWRDWEFCPHGCRDGRCLEACGVDITSLDFEDWVEVGDRADIRVSVRNLAEEDQIISLVFYVDGERTAYYSVWVSGGNTLIKDFFFYPEETSEIGVEASSNCGGFDAASATVRVIERTTEEAYTPSEDTGEEEVIETFVYVYPDSLDIELGSSKTLVIDIRSSRTQDFSIDVAGVPEGWLSYDDRIGVTGKEKAYVYVTPKELGSHDLAVTVKALEEDKVFKENVNVFCAQSKEVVRVDWSGDFVTGLVSTVTSAWFLLAVAVIIFVAVILTGAYTLTYEEY